MEKENDSIHCGEADVAMNIIFHPEEGGFTRTGSFVGHLIQLLQCQESQQSCSDDKECVDTWEGVDNGAKSVILDPLGSENVGVVDQSLTVGSKSRVSVAHHNPGQRDNPLSFLIINLIFLG